MSFIATVRDLGLAITGRLAWLPPLAARLTVGLVFVWSGWGKLHHLDKITDYFRELGIPAPQIQAPFASATELVCGCLILLGLVTRLASIPLMVVMTVAILTAKRAELAQSLHDDGFGEMLNSLFGEAEFLYILLLLWLVVSGGGALSLDRLLFRKGPEQPPVAEKK
jgi:putative oxidoreductase